eukprot:scaffold3031_cov126-Isochrysis_galbana.AAC.5
MGVTPPCHVPRMRNTTAPQRSQPRSIAWSHGVDVEQMCEGEPAAASLTLGTAPPLLFPQRRFRSLLSSHQVGERGAAPARGEQRPPSARVAAAAAGGDVGDGVEQHHHGGDVVVGVSLERNLDQLLRGHRRVGVRPELLPRQTHLQPWAGGGWAGGRAAPGRTCDRGQGGVGGSAGASHARARVGDRVMGRKGVGRACRRQC